MTEQLTDYVAPDDYITLKVKWPTDADKTEREFFMSAGLIRRLSNAVQGVDNISEIYTNGALQEYMMVETIAPKTERGKVLDDRADLDDYQVSMDDADKLLDWINGHLYGFFIKTASKVEAEVNNKNSNLQKLARSTNGLVALAQKKQSAGDQDAN